MMGSSLRMGLLVANANRRTNNSLQTNCLPMQEVSSNCHKVLQNNNPVMPQDPGSAAVQTHC